MMRGNVEHLEKNFYMKGDVLAATIARKPNVRGAGGPDAYGHEQTGRDVYGWWFLTHGV